MTIPEEESLRYKVLHDQDFDLDDGGGGTLAGDVTGPAGANTVTGITPVAGVLVPVFVAKQIAFDTAGINPGAFFFTPQAGDRVYDAGFDVLTAWNATAYAEIGVQADLDIGEGWWSAMNPKFDLTKALGYPGSNDPPEYFNGYDNAVQPTLKDWPNARNNQTGVSFRRLAPLRINTVSPITVSVSIDPNGPPGSPSTATAGAGEVWAMIYTNNPTYYLRGDHLA